MELVKGAPITAFCDANKLSARERLELFSNVCDAVQHAHQKGIIHRDLKPSNILVMSHDGKPVVKVIDFGVAKAISQQLTDKTIYTQFSQLIGTPMYMSPEQAGESGLDIDTRTDIYALGVLLYEMLTGTTPFDKERLHQASFEEMRRIVREEDPPRPSTRISTMGEVALTISTQRQTDPRRLMQMLRGELDWVVMKCLEKDRNRRYDSAKALAQDIERHLHGEAVHACPPSAVYRLRKFAQRNKTAFIATLALVTSFLLAVVVLAVSTIRITKERDDKVAALEQAQRAERAAQEQLCDSLFVQARARRSSQQPGQRLESLKALEQAARHSRELGRGPADLMELRNEAIACLALPDVRLEREWEGSPPGTNGLGLDGRFERYAWSFQDEGIRICRLADHQELMHVPTLPAERAARWPRPRFSPDGRFLVVDYALWTGRRPLQVWELRTGTSRLLLPLDDVTTEPVFSPDGRALAVGLPDNSVRIFDLATGRETKRLPLDLVPERLAFHPDGQKLAVSSTKQFRVQVQDLQSAKVLYTLPHPAGVQAVAWHPEGQLLATGCDDHRIYLWDGVSGERRGMLEGHRWEVHDLAFNHAGDQLASFGWDMTLRLWDVATRRPLWHLENIRVVAFRQEGPLMAAGISGRQVQVWACVPSTELHVFRGPTLDVRTLAVSPDSRCLFGFTYGGGSWLWDVSRKREVMHFADISHCAWGAGENLVLSTKQGQLLRRRFPGLPEGPGERLRLGPAESLFSPPLEPDVPQFSCCCGRDRRLLARVSPRSGVQVFRLDGTPRKLWERAAPGLGGWTLSASGDGRWLAIGTEDGGRGILILEADSGELVKELLIGDARPALSPDRRWLVTTSGRLTTPEGECCLWRIDTWQNVRARPLNRSSSSAALLAVSPDGAVLAVTHHERGSVAAPGNARGNRPPDSP
jgi:hypothetical protein